MTSSFSGRCQTLNTQYTLERYFLQSQMAKLIMSAISLVLQNFVKAVCVASFLRLGYTADVCFSLKSSILPAVDSSCMTSCRRSIVTFDLYCFVSQILQVLCCEQPVLHSPTPRRYSPRQYKPKLQKCKI